MAVVLVAEDDDDIRFIVGRVLERAGHRVVSAVDGLDGLAALRRQRFDIVITDLDMPRLSGGEMCQRGRAEGLLDDVPILVISGSLQPGDPRVGEIGAVRALRKPFVGAELLSCVSDALPRHQ